MKESVKTVYLILLEFLKIEKKASTLPKDYKMYDAYYALLLAEIVEEFIIKTKSNPFKIFDAVSDAAAKKGNGINFLIYRKILEKEKKKGFKDLMFVLDKRKKYHKNNTKTL